MKKFKYILSALLLMVTVFVPLTLTGCTKHYKINVSIVEGSAVGNDVKVIVDETVTSKSVVGENEVEKGSKFVYAVCPGADYEVFYIKEDGVIRYHADQDNNTLRPDDSRIVRPRIADIKGDHKIEVAFRLRTYAIEYYYKNPDTSEGQPAYLQLKYADGTPYRTEALARQNIEEIPGFSSFGFKYFDGSTYQLFSVPADIFPLMSDYILFTDKTEAELKELLNFTDTTSGAGESSNT